MFLIAVIVVVSLTGSFLCSLVEASLYSMSHARIETLRRRGDPRGDILLRMRERIDEPIAAILILNTIMNTAGAAIAGGLVARYYGNTMVGVFTGLFTAGVLFLSEIVPKSLGFKFANRLAPVLATPIRLLIFMLWPLVRLCVIVTNLFGRNSRIAVPTEEDIISLTALGVKGGSILSQEARWIANALYLDKTIVRDIMTPLSVVRRVPEQMRLGEVQADREHWRFSRVPVHQPGNPDLPVGVVQRRVVFRSLIEGRDDLEIKEIMTPPIFVDSRMPANDLLSSFIKQKQHLFCVRDRGGKWIGIVALEDVLEALLGAEIVEQHDLYENMQLAARELATARTLSQDLKKAGGVIDQVVSSVDSDMVGRKISESGIPQEAILGPVVRGEDVIVPSGSLTLEAGDRVTLIGRKKDVEETKRRLNPGEAEKKSAPDEGGGHGPK